MSFWMEQPASSTSCHDATHPRLVWNDVDRIACNPLRFPPFPDRWRNLSPPHLKVWLHLPTRTGLGHVHEIGPNLKPDPVLDAYVGRRCWMAGEVEGGRARDSQQMGSCWCSSTACDINQNLLAQPLNPTRRQMQNIPQTLVERNREGVPGQGLSRSTPANLFLLRQMTKTVQKLKRKSRERQAVNRPFLTRVILPVECSLYLYMSAEPD